MIGQWAASAPCRRDILRRLMNKPDAPFRRPAALPMLAPVQHLTLREQVAQAVRLALMNGLLQPGQPVSVKSIATMVGASVMPAAQAQRADAPTIQTPFGRAPLSFADIVERV